MPIFDPLCIFDPRQLQGMIARGEVAFLKRLLHFGINVNGKAKYENTALHVATEHKQLEIMKLLLDHGVDPDEKNGHGRTAMELAILNFDKAAIELLLDHGAQMIEGDLLYGLNKIHVAVIRDQKDMLSDLLTMGIDLEQKANFLKRGSFTALQCAAITGNKEIVETLLSNGAKFDTNCRFQFSFASTIHAAAFGGNVQVFKIFQELGCDIHARDDHYENTILHYAVKGANSELIEFILRHGIDIDVKNKWDQNVLFSAVEGDCKDIETVVELLLNFGLCINEADSSGKTPLNHAILYNSTDSVKILLERGATIGPDALHKACTNLNESIITLLLKYGADVNMKNSAGKSPLAIASESFHDAYNSRETIVDILIKSGAHVKSDDSLLWNAIELYSEDLPHLTIEPEDNYFEALSGNRRVIKKLLQRGLDINSLSEDNYTVLEYAMYSGFGYGIFLPAFLDSGLEINDYGEGEKSAIQFTLDNVDYETAIFAKILTRHIVKIRHLNRYVSAENLEAIENNKELKDFWNDCEEEIEKMKEKSGLYELFVCESSNQLAKLARQKGVARILTLNKHKTLFPRYADHLEEQFQKGTETLSLLHEVRRFFHAVTDSEGNEHLPKLPIVVNSMTFDYLDTEDLETLAYVCNPRRRQHGLEQDRE